jgi:alkylation response protein AidB-like acyl-CoA dehydrogenase
MDVHRVEMTTAEQAAAFAAAAALAAEFQRVGAMHDRENSFPQALVGPFRASGLAALTVPKRFGGWGADIHTFARCIQILAEGDPACALAFNMHLAVIGFFRGMWSEAHQARYFTGVSAKAEIPAAQGCAALKSPGRTFQSFVRPVSPRRRSSTWPRSCSRCASGTAPRPRFLRHGRSALPVISRRPRRE